MRVDRPRIACCKDTGQFRKLSGLRCHTIFVTNRSEPVSRAYFVAASQRQPVTTSGYIQNQKKEYNRRWINRAMRCQACTGVPTAHPVQLGYRRALGG